MFVDVRQYSRRTYKVVGVASDVESSSIKSIIRSPDKLTVQRRNPAQRPKIDLAMTGLSDVVLNSANKLRSPKETGREAL